MKAKDYAIELGLARPGKGRMSLEAHAAIRAAIEAGTHTFPDYKGAIDKSATPKGRTIDKDAPSAPVLPVERPDNYGDARMRYPLDQMFQGTRANGKTVKVNARQACMRGRYSLAGCFEHAGQPHSVLVSSMEQIDVTPIGE